MSTGSSTADSVHQANLATFRSYRQTIDELYHKPHTRLGDHASLVKRLQEWRKAVSHLTAWVDDDRAYYAQARPEIAAFDSVRAVDQIRSSKGESNWIRATEKEFEGILIDYIKLIKTAFSPQRQARYTAQTDVDALNRGRVLYNGLYSFERRLQEVREGTTRRASAPQLQQNPTSHPASPSSSTSSSMPVQRIRSASRHNPHNNARPMLSEGAASAPNMRQYTHSGNPMRKNSLPVGAVVPAQPGPPTFHTPAQMHGTGPIPTSPTVWNQPAVQTIHNSRPLPPSLAANATTVPLNVPSHASDAPSNVQAPVTAAPPKDQDPEWYDLDVDEDELEALDRSEWGIDATGNNQPGNVLPTGGPNASNVSQTDSISDTSHPTSGPLIGSPLKREEQAASRQQSGQPVAPGPLTEATPLQPSIVPKVEAEYSDARLLRSPSAEQRPPKSRQALERRKSVLAQEIIDVDDLSDDELPVGPTTLESRGPPEPVTSTPADDVINIHDSDEEMEVDELDPSESGEPSGESGEPKDQPMTAPAEHVNPPSTKSLQPSATPTRSILTPAQQLIKDVNELPPEVRARIRQVAKGPMILQYLSIEPSITRDAAEERFDKMSDQTVFEVYVKTQAARRIIDHFKNTLNQPGHKLHLPHIEVKEVPPGPPVLLGSQPGIAGMQTNTIEFNIPANTMASLERWKARFVTSAGSHGALVSVELACYPADAFYPTKEGGSRQLTPNAQMRTWPDGGVLWAFVNREFSEKDSSPEVKLFLSPPPFVEAGQPVDISDFIREGRNVVQFVHLGGMEHFVFAVQTRKMPPPQITWPGVLKRVQSLDSSSSGYAGLLNRLSTMLEQK